MVHLLGRLRLASASKQWKLILDVDSLELETPLLKQRIERDDIVDIRLERAEESDRSNASRYRSVYLSLHPRLQVEQNRYVELPPVFDATPGVLCERLLRWREAESPMEPLPVETERAMLGAKLYDDAAAGSPRPGDIVIRHGRAWLQQGPYVSVLLAATLLLSQLRLPDGLEVAVEEGWGIITLPLLAASLLTVPLFWLMRMARDVRPRRGIALLITPSEILMRIRSGMLRARWSTIEAVRIESSPSWSVLHGYRRARVLIFDRFDAPEIRYEEAYLGVPCEIVQGLCEAYLRGCSSGTD
jgi:hypothetical protein